MSATISRSSAIGKPSSITNAADSHSGTGARHGEVVDRAVHREMADRAAGKAPRLHDERVGGERQPLAGRQRRASPRRRGAAVAAGERVEEHRIDERGRRLAAGAVGERDDLVGQTRPAPAERLDPVEHGRFAIADCASSVAAPVARQLASCTARHRAKPSAACVSWMRWTLSARRRGSGRRAATAAISPP